MSAPRAIRCSVLRGGTSKGLFVHAHDLPEDRATRDAVLRAATDSPDVREIDGMGGGHPLTSKAAVSSPLSASTSTLTISSYWSGPIAPKSPIIRTVAIFWRPLNHSPFSSWTLPVRPAVRSYPPATYLARCNDLFTGRDEPVNVTNVAVSMHGTELQDREFVSAIRERRDPNAAVNSVLDCYRVLDELAAQL